MFGVNAVAQTDVILPAEPTQDLPAIRTIGLADLKDALAKGLDDFRAMPTHVIFLSVLYPIIGIALGAATFGYDVIPLLFPLAAGFALIGPLAAIGLYELSRRRELGLDTSWKHAFDIIHSPSIWGIAALGVLLLALFAVWIAVAHAIYVAAFGIDEPVSSIAFARKVLTTPEGYRLIVVGNAVGFLFAVVAFALSVVSFPLLLDRHVGVAAAIVTSVRAILKNPVTMATWALLVSVALAIGSLPFFIGLAVVMPVLGHATWHLYRKVVEPDEGSRPEFHPAPKGRRYAADFPVSLFVRSSRADQS
jgi:uncharacterized membrane protein